jgi:ABC-type dipeptide/oligopeptide/nickel transport system permease component
MSWLYFSKRLLGFSFSVLSIIVIVFFAVRFLPGDPATYILGEMAHPSDIANLRMSLGLDKPLSIQFMDYCLKLTHGDLGLSVSRNKPVLNLIVTYLKSSFYLSLTSLLVATFFAVLIVFIFKKNSQATPIFLMTTSFFSSLPIFLVAPFGILYFSIRLKILPVSGSETWSHFLLPSFCLGLVLFSPLARLMRSTFLAEYRNDYVRTIRSKGGSEYRVLWVHVFKNALVPIFLMWAHMWGGIVAGAVVTETLFDWPGLGKLFYGAFQSRDYPLIQGVVLCVAILYSFLQLLVDFVSAKIDRRMEFQK